MTESDAKPPENPAGKRQAIVLAGIVVALATFNALAAWLHSNDNSGEDWLEDWLGVLILGVLVFEPMLFGIWTALGSGSIVTRLPLVIPCLLMLVVAPGLRKASLADVERREFVVAVLVGVAIFAVTTVLFLAVRWLTGLRVEPTRDQAASPSRVRFSMKYLLATISLYAVVLGMTVQLVFQAEPPPPTFTLFGPDFFIHVLIIGGAVLFAILLPTISVPLLVLCPRISKRACQIAVACWAIATVLFVEIWYMVDGEPWLSMLQFVLIVQLGGILAGVLTALAMRLGGFRLVSGRSRVVHPELLASQPGND